jgi:protein required for attachment to host cells
MKKLRTRYLIASEEAFRLVHTHEPDWALIATHKAGADAHHYIHEMVDSLAAEWATAKHDRIVIAAGPKLLGDLRAHLPKTLHAHVAAELHKDLVKIPLHDLPPHFAKVSETAEEA